MGTQQIGSLSLGLGVSRESLVSPLVRAVSGNVTLLVTVKTPPRAWSQTVRWVSLSCPGLSDGGLYSLFFFQLVNSLFHPLHHFYKPLRQICIHLHRLNELLVRRWCVNIVPDQMLCVVSQGTEGDIWCAISFLSKTHFQPRIF